ncbi:hypothetical protein VTO73DRAFT_6439 [Trametes versicolor]
MPVLAIGVGVQVSNEGPELADMDERRETW